MSSITIKQELFAKLWICQIWGKTKWRHEYFLDQGETCRILCNERVVLIFQMQQLASYYILKKLNMVLRMSCRFLLLVT